jgi:hypothetical protein
MIHHSQQLPCPRNSVANRTYPGLSVKNKLAKRKINQQLFLIQKADPSEPARPPAHQIADSVSIVSMAVTKCQVASLMSLSQALQRADRRCYPKYFMEKALAEYAGCLPFGSA